MRKLYFFIGILLVGMFFASCSNDVVAQEQETPYKMIGCYPSSQYMSGNGLSLENTDYLDYTVDGADNFYEATQCTGLTRGEYESVKEYEPRVSLTNSNIECISNDENCKNVIINVSPHYPCGDESAQCFFVNKSNVNLKIKCCADESLIDSLGNNLDPSQNTEVPDYTCTSVADKSTVTLSDAEIKKYNCTNNIVSYSACVDMTGKINGKDTDAGSRYLCSEGTGGVNGHCCNGINKVLNTDSNVGCGGTGEDEKACLSCMYNGVDGGEPTGAIWTSLGCIDPSPSGVITRLYQIGIGIVGGLILLIKVPQIVIAYNSGDPEKIQEAQTGIWSIAGGLLLLVFATIVLETLGVHVIGLPSGFV